MPDADQIELWNIKLGPLTAPDRVAWARNQFGERLIATSSFGLQAAVMLHLIAEQAPQTPVVFVDTGYLFRETYQYLETLQKRLNLNIYSYQARMTTARQEAIYGKRWEGDLDALEDYLEMNKLEPMRRAIADLQAGAWISGIRRSQASTRENRALVEEQAGILKIYPLVDWTDDQVEAYFLEHELPRHPLAEDGYASLGDWHSTTKLGRNQSPEETRFGGLKRECGLHDNTRWKPNRK